MTQRGFTLLEAAFGAVILMIGIVTLSHISLAFMHQISDIHTTEGQPAIEERLVHDQIALMCSPGNNAAYPNATPTVPPLVSDGTTYSVTVAAANPGGAWVANSVYSIQVKVANGGKTSPAVYFSKGAPLCF